MSKAPPKVTPAFLLGAQLAHAVGNPEQWADGIRPDCIAGNLEALAQLQSQLAKAQIRLRDRFAAIANADAVKRRDSRVLH